MNQPKSKHPMKRASIAVLSTALLLTASAQLAFAADSSSPAQSSTTAVQVVSNQPTGAVKLTSKSVKQSTALLETDLNVPVISGMKDTAYQNALNANLAARAKAVVDAITKQAKNDAAAADGSYEFRPYGATIKFELISDGSQNSGNVISFKMLTYTFTGGAHGITVVDTYNIHNTAKASPIKLKELFGPSYLSIINRTVKAEIASRPADFFKDAFKSITDQQAFYVEDGILYLVFQQYEIAPYAAGLPEIALVIPDTGVTVPAGIASLPVVADGQSLHGTKLYTAAGGVVMAPLRPLAEALGFKLGWNAASRTYEVRKGQAWTSLTKGKDRYAVTDKASFTLGAAPVLKNGQLYVPLAFFSKVLNAKITYTKQAVELSLSK
ncbi:stalk domain-containing protein [Paenibacillus sp. R14(2021)]|uniref:stalk domain-containing protein n=1 Tax=Paenibacillus sp. R14(2021) TaxID=2859228 RepID=UPI001C615423|nr:DUF4163 domain-containing protein [Paenibacillus sp. R14(2021)]